MNREDDIQKVCNALIQDAINFHSNCNSSDYYSCQHCGRKCEVDENPKNIEHKLDCVYLIAKDLTTKQK